LKIQRVLFMALHTEPGQAPLEQEEEEEVVEELGDAPAHHPYAPPDEVTFHQRLLFHLVS
jgi:hypothetical protein